MPNSPLNRERVFNGMRDGEPREVADDALRLAIDYCAAFSDGEDIRQFISRLARDLTLRRERVVLPLGPGDEIAGDALVRAVEPLARQVRNEIFDKESVPFPTWERAVRWLKRTARSQAQATAATGDEVVARRKEVIRLCRELTELTGHQWTAGVRSEAVPYVPPRERWVHHLPVKLHTDLATLAQQAREISKATGFSEPSVVAYILTGRKPKRTSVTTESTFQHVHLDSGTSLRRTEVTLRIRSPEISRERWEKVRQIVRKELAAGRRKMLSREDLILWRTVHRLGGLPATDKEAFWDQVRDACEEEGLVYKNWRGPYMRYRRLLKSGIIPPG